MIRAIDNQPIVFDQVTDECNDSLQQQYCAKFTTTDTIYVQFKNEPCVENEFCEFAPEWGNDLIDNGTFSSDPTPEWTLSSATWDNVNNRLVLAASDTVYQDIAGGPSVKKFRVTFTISGYSAGTLNVGLTGQLTSILGDDVTANCTYQQEITLSGTDTNIPITRISFITDADWVGNLDMVRLEYITDDCYAIINDWTLTEDGTLTHTSGVDGYIVKSASDLVAGNYYRVTIVTKNKTGGSLYLTYDLINTYSEILETQYKYYFTAITTDLVIHATSDYDGEIVSITIDTLNKFGYGDIYLHLNDDNDDADLSSYVHYDGDYITLRFTWEDAVEVLARTPDPQCCYIGYVDDCNYSEVVESNCIEFRELHDCTKYIEGVSNCAAFGFDFTTFKLVQRIPFIKFNPVYPFKNEYITGSDGILKRYYAEREKKYTAKVDYVDEPVHNTLSLQLLCDNLEVDGEKYFCVSKEYSPDWDSNGKVNVAQVKFDLEKYDNVVFNNSCCDSQPCYICKAGGAWGYESWTEVERWNYFREYLAFNGNGFDENWRFVLKSVKINGIEYINGYYPELTITWDVAGTFTPSLVIEKRRDARNIPYHLINNLNDYTAFVQNINQFVNRYTAPHGIIFYDNMTIVEYCGSPTFEIVMDKYYDTFSTVDPANEWHWRNDGISIYSGANLTEHEEIWLKEEK